MGRDRGGHRPPITVARDVRANGGWARYRPASADKASGIKVGRPVVADWSFSAC